MSSVSVPDRIRHFLFRLTAGLVGLVTLLGAGAALAQNAYVPNSGLNNVSVINTVTNVVVTTVAVGSLPYGVAVSADGTRA